MMANSLAVAHGKGGSGKTHVAVNFAANEAKAITDNSPDGIVRNHERVVLVDLDPQANAGADLGITDHDQGKSLGAAALEYLEEPVLYKTGRENFFYVAGGSELNDLSTVAMVMSKGDPRGLAVMVRKALSPFDDGHTLFVFDTPPSTGSALSDAALQLAKWLVIPTPIDQRSIDGVGTLLERILDTSSLIHPIGITLFGVKLGDTSINKRAADTLTTALDGAFPILKSSIRQASKAQTDSRYVGLTAGEYARFASEESSPWYEQLKLPADERLTFAKNAPLLAQDYEKLHQEIAEAMFGQAVGQ